MNKIYIRGEIIPLTIKGLDSNAYTHIVNIQDQLKELDPTKPFTVEIDSIGGDVNTGFAIYSMLREYATNNNVEINTKIINNCCSIATVPFLAGDRREVNPYISPFIHNAWTYAKGDANTVLRVATDLKVVNNKIAKFYAEHTLLSVDEALELMANNTYITPKEAVNIKFATHISKIVKPKALLRLNNKLSDKLNINENENDMTKNEGLLAKIKNLFVEHKNEVVLLTELDAEIVFAELDEGDVPKIGDQATVDGDVAKGDYDLKSKDKYTFVNGVLTTIVEAVAETEEADELEDVQAKALADLGIKLEQLGVKLNETQELNVTLNAKLDNITSVTNDNKDVIGKMRNLVSDFNDDEVKDERKKEPKAENTSVYGQWAKQKLNK